jgi:hypothetical protein
MYYSTQELEARGWIKSWIKRFLPKPDDIKKLGYYRQKYFYADVRVAEIESSDEWIKSALVAQKHREVGIKTTQKRRKEYFNYLENQMPVRVRELPHDIVQLEAIDFYNAHKAYKSQFRDYDDYVYRLAGTDSDKSFLDRIIVTLILPVLLLN